MLQAESRANSRSSIVSSYRGKALDLRAESEPEEESRVPRSEILRTVSFQMTQSVF